jgi:hypothetical protein
MTVIMAMTMLASFRGALVALVGAAAALAYSLMRRRRRQASKARSQAWNDPKKQCEAIYHHLSCSEFPWECFYAINFAFYRTFASPTISRLYCSTGNIAKAAGKRVADTDILMHAWIDFGIDSRKGQESWEHLNRIHAVWKRRTSNQDFVYVLCCFIVDTIRFIDLFGWRKLTSLEREALYHFWAKLGRRMEIEDIPGSLEAAYRVVDGYIASDITSAETKDGRDLTNSITDLLCQWYWFVPRGLVYGGASALLSIIGGPTFVRKVGLGEPSAVMTHALLLLGRLRAAVLSCLPMRTEPRLLSEILMQAHYPMAAAAAGGAPTSRPRSGKLLDFSLVGPVGLLPVLEEERLAAERRKSKTIEPDVRVRSTTL